jgi:2-polyprenyl-6-methoxyphenol hydroxylase-like FAD-dependent oxidoreductase
MTEPAVGVLDVGAGPAGLTTAVPLARAGVRDRIIERLPQPSTASRAKGIQPRSLEIMDDLGAAAPILEVGRVDMQMRFHDAKGELNDRPTIPNRASAADEPAFPAYVAQFLPRRTTDEEAVTDVPIQERIDELPRS